MGTIYNENNHGLAQPDVMDCPAPQAKPLVTMSCFIIGKDVYPALTVLSVRLIMYGPTSIQGQCYMILCHSYN